MEKRTSDARESIERDVRAWARFSSREISSSETSKHIRDQVLEKQKKKKTQGQKANSSARGHFCLFFSSPLCSFHFLRRRRRRRLFGFHA